MNLCCLHPILWKHFFLYLPTMSAIWLIRQRNRPSFYCCCTIDTSLRHIGLEQNHETLVMLCFSPVTLHHTHWNTSFVSRVWCRCLFFAISSHYIKEWSSFLILTPSLHKFRCWEVRQPWTQYLFEYYYVYNSHKNECKEWYLWKLDFQLLQFSSRKFCIPYGTSEANLKQM